MDRLLEDYTYGDVARILNEKGFKTGDGLSLTSDVVGSIRTRYGLRARFDRLRERVMLTIAEMAQTCGVATTTISHWQRQDLIHPHRLTIEMRFCTNILGRIRPEEG
jgi:DNA-binding XRE family transcriptional regulator